MNGCSPSCTGRKAPAGAAPCFARRSRRRNSGRTAYSSALRANSRRRASRCCASIIAARATATALLSSSDCSTRVADTRAAIDELKRQVPGLDRVTLVGLRFGATLAAAAAAGRDDVERLVLWDPVVDGADYMQSVLRRT